MYFVLSAAFKVLFKDIKKIKYQILADNWYSASSQVKSGKTSVF